MHLERKSYRMPIRILPPWVRLVWFWQKLWERAKGSHYKLVHVNIRPRGLFATTVLLSGTDQLLATRREMHHFGWKQEAQSTNLSATAHRCSRAAHMMCAGQRGRYDHATNILCIRFLRSFTTFFHFGHSTCGILVAVQNSTFRVFTRECPFNILLARPCTQNW